MAGLLGLALMVVGGLLVLSALRGYSLFLAARKRNAARVIDESWKRMLAGMLLLGAALIASGFLLAE
jgi:hypothetical protein